MKRITMTMALTVALSVSAFAGEIPTVGFVPPPPPPPGAAQVANVPGEIPSTGFAQHISNELLLMIFSRFVS